MRDKYGESGSYHWKEYYSEKGNLYQSHVNLVVDFFKKEKGKLLDVGCGDGLILSKLNENENLNCFGIDISQVAIKLAIAKGVRNCAVLDLFELTGNDQYDCVFLGDVLEHLPDCRDGLVKVREHLKPDGMILITIPLQKKKNSYDYHLFDKESALSLVESVFDTFRYREDFKKMYFKGVR